MKPSPTPASSRSVAAAQACYYLLTAVWPFVDRRRFEAVTGPKRDWWLVLTVAALVGVIGVALGLGARRRVVPTEVKLLGVGTAGSLGVIDVVYVARRRIRPTYLIDAAAQALLLRAWFSRR